MNIDLVGADHPLAAALRELIPGAQAHPWGDPAEPPDADALIFLPPWWAVEPPGVGAVIADLEVAWAWLNPWVNAVKDRGQGCVLYVMQFDGVFGSAENVLLAERDGGFLAQMRAMAMELARFGIRVNGLVLGPHGDAPDAAANPLKHRASWGDAARVAAFLIGDGAAHLTGQTLVHAGGADVGRVPL